VPGIRAAEPGSPATWQITIINLPRRLRPPYGAYYRPGSSSICAMFAWGSESRQSGKVGRSWPDIPDHVLDIAGNILG
jgi:hypothetical protein